MEVWLHSLKVAQLLRSAACLHTNQSRSYLNHLLYDTWAADGIQQTLSYSRMTLKHLSFCDTKFCIPACKKSVSKVCDQEVTASFTSARGVNRLPSMYFVRYIKSWKAPGPLLSSGLFPALWLGG